VIKTSVLEYLLKKKHLFLSLWTGGGKSVCYQVFLGWAWFLLVSESRHSHYAYFKIKNKKICSQWAMGERVEEHIFQPWLAMMEKPVNHKFYSSLYYLFTDSDGYRFAVCISKARVFSTQRRQAQTTRWNRCSDYIRLLNMR
jgi:hypothetical protein